VSDFPFVDDDALRANLDTALRHVTELVAIADNYDRILSSSFRKTIIINTASIIEALLLWRLKKKVKTKEIELSEEWKFYDVKILHKINVSEQVVGAKRKREKKQVSKLDFVRIIDLCVKHKIVTEQFSKELHKVRELRNRLHLGGLEEVEREYTKRDLNFVFGVAERVISVVSN